MEIVIYQPNFIKCIFFEHILDRLSKSKYKHNIILKGGLLLSSIIGDDEIVKKYLTTTRDNKKYNTNYYNLI